MDLLLPTCSTHAASHLWQTKASSLHRPLATTSVQTSTAIPIEINFFNIFVTNMSLDVAFDCNQVWQEWKKVVAFSFLWRKKRLFVKTVYLFQKCIFKSSNSYFNLIFIVVQNNNFSARHLSELLEAFINTLKSLG